jgi:hypothetical protein
MFCGVRVYAATEQRPSKKQSFLVPPPGTELHPDLLAITAKPAAHSSPIKGILVCPTISVYIVSSGNSS